MYCMSSLLAQWSIEIINNHTNVMMPYRRVVSTISSSRKFDLHVPNKSFSSHKLSGLHAHSSFQNHLINWKKKKVRNWKGTKLRMKPVGIFEIHRMDMINFSIFEVWFLSWTQCLGEPFHMYVLYMDWPNLLACEKEQTHCHKKKNKIKNNKKQNSV